MTVETEFISYARSYDLYEGNTDWSELSTEQQDAIIRAELSNSDINPEDLIMQSGLIKKQAQGLRGIFVVISMACEKRGTIKNMHDWSETQKILIINFLKETDLGIRIAQTFMQPDTAVRRLVEGKTLERFSDPYFTDKTLCMNWEEIRAFIYSGLNHPSTQP